MNYKFLFTAFVALMSMVLVSCSDDEATYLSEIRVSKSYVSLPVPENKKTVASASIEVDANSPWAFYDSEDTKDTYKIPSWLKITPLKGEAGKTKVTFEADSASGRECSVKILCAGKEQVINVIQGVKEVENATCAQIIAGPESKTYRVTGTCTGIYNTQYGNWYLNDGTGEITIYGTLDKNGQTKNFASLGIEAGDIVTVEGPKKEYKNADGSITHELVDVTVIKIEKSLIKVIDTDPANATAPVEGGEVKFNLECKGNGVSVVIPDEVKDWLSMVNVTSGSTPVVVFKVAPNAAGDRQVDVTFKTTDANGKEYTAVATVYQKGAIVDSNIADFLAAEVGNTQYRLSGVVVGVTDAAKGRFTIRDYSGEVYVYNAAEFNAKVGDIVTVEGKRAAYNGTAQVGSGVVMNTIPVTKVTLAEFLTKEDNKDVYYMVTGTIDEIANATYGNLYLKDGDTRVYVYGTYPGWGATGDARKNLIATLGLEVGDELTVIGSKTTYNGTPQVNNGIYFGHVK